MVGINWNKNVALSRALLVREGRLDAEMAGPLKYNGQCPLCRETGREGRLELRQINAFEALWICGNLQVSLGNDKFFMNRFASFSSVRIQCI